MSNKKRADKLFEERAYAHAANVYRRIVKKDSFNTHAALQLAECYRLINHTIESEYWYSHVIKRNPSELPDNYKLHYADVLLSNGKLEEAQKWYHQHSEEESNSEVSLKKKKAIQQFQRFYEDSLQYTVSEIPVNSPESDFCPVFYNNGILFLSSREQRSIIKMNNGSDQQSFYNTYFVEYIKGGGYGEVERFTSFDQSLHEGPVTFFDGGNKAIFSSSLKSKKKVDGVRLGLFMATKSEEDGEWENITSLPFNNTHYSNSHPYFDQKKQVLYFVSNMKGGYGGTDIYKVKLEEGAWGKPENLGSPINTSGNEMFPFVTKDGQVYFSSNGHPGMGGLDIFRADLSVKNSEVSNLGFPMNSPNDDFSLIIDKTGTRGYFSSNRKNGKTDDDLYEVQFHSVKFEGKVMERLKGTPMKDVTVKIKDKRSGDVEGVFTTNLKGNFELLIKPGKTYTLEFVKEDHKVLTAEVLVSSKEELVVRKSYLMEKSNKRFIEGKILIDGEPVSKCKVILADLETDSLEVNYTNAAGVFQHEINADTTTIIYAEMDGKKGIYKMETLKNKKKGSGISYFTFELEDMPLMELKGTYSNSDASSVVKDTLYLKNDLTMELSAIPVASGKFRMFVWVQGKYSIYRKDQDDYIELTTFVPEKMKLLRLTRFE